MLSILGRVDWINRDRLASFIGKAQDPDDGGIADRPDDMPDIFHTFFGLSGLCLLGKLPDDYRKIDPVYALPVDVVMAQKLEAQVIGADGVVVAMVSEVLRLGYHGRRKLTEMVCQLALSRGQIVISAGAESSGEAIHFAQHAEESGFSLQRFEGDHAPK